MDDRQRFTETLARVCERNQWTSDANTVDIGFDSGRRQSVRLEFFDFEEREIVRFFTTIGDAERIDPLRLSQGLRVTFGLPHGALALHKNDLVMVDTLMIADADDGEIEAILQYLAETADHFEQTMFGGDAH